MTRDEFCSLPPAVALGLVFDVASARLRELKAPRSPFPPKFDGRSFRKGGMFVWLSEMALSDLVFYHQRAKDGAESGSEYAERNAKDAKALGYWVTWRQWFPYERWSGERNKLPVTAEPPSDDPQQHYSQKKDDAPEQPKRSYSFSEEAEPEPDEQEPQF